MSEIATRAVNLREVIRVLLTEEIMPSVQLTQSLVGDVNIRPHVRASRALRETAVRGLRGLNVAGNALSHSGHAAAIDPRPTPPRLPAAPLK